MNTEKILEQLPERIEANEATVQEMYIQFGYIQTPSVESFFELAKINDPAANEILAVIFPETQETGNAAGALVSLAGTLLSVWQNKQQNAAESLEIAYKKIEEQQKELTVARILATVSLAVLVIAIVVFFLIKK